MKINALLLTTLTFVAALAHSKASPTVTTETFANGQGATVNFTLIPNISSTDLANGLPDSAYSVQAGSPLAESGAPSLLGNGALQFADNQPNQSFFSNDDPFTFTIDLGAVNNIGQVNSYSRHFDSNSLRAAQSYTLWGSVDNMTFTLITSVHNTQENHTAIYGNSITDTTGSLGNYRYLQFQTHSNTFGTFYGEIDVVAAVPEPSALTLGLVGGAGLIGMLRRRRC
jgi:hypothetical protein